MSKSIHRFLNRMHEAGARRLKADLVHCVTEQQPVFCLLNGFQLGTDKLDPMPVERAVLGERDGCIQSSLTTHRRQ